MSCLSIFVRHIALKVDNLVNSHTSRAPAWSPYRYGFSNPVNVIDPTGNLEMTDRYNQAGTVKTGEQVETEDDGRDEPVDVLYTDGYGWYSSRSATGAFSLSGVYANVGGGSSMDDDCCPGGQSGIGEYNAAEAQAKKEARDLSEVLAENHQKWNEGGAKALEYTSYVYGGTGVVKLVIKGLWKTIVGRSVAAKGSIKYLYHYTSREAAQSISQSGLRVGKDGFSYLTNNSALKPLQAQIELALPANRALPNSLLRINTSGLSPAAIIRVQGNLPGLGAGGGTEFLFNQHIPAKCH